MRNTIAAAAAIAFTLIVSPMAAPPARAAVDVSFDFFYNDLSPHGSWLVSGSYGRVWQPQVYRPGWNPYYDGHWEYADVGWVWVSDYSWGAVPYHYGTWVMDADYGWVWVPGYTWAPAWVVFRQGPQAVGWAPVSPEFSIGISFGSRGYYEPPPSAFVFVPVQQFAAPRIRPYIVPERQVNTYIRNTTIINNNLVVQNNVVVNRGPDVRVVERAAGRTIRPEPIERVQRVAPFQGFSRQQIAVPTDRSGQRVVRAAEPVNPGVAQNRTGRSTFPQQQTQQDRYNQIQQQNREREQRSLPPPRAQQQPQQQQQRPQQQPQPPQQQQVPQRPPQQDAERRQQQSKEQQAQQRTDKERQVLPQPIPPDEPRPLPSPRPNQPRPPVPQPPPQMQPDRPAQQQGHGPQPQPQRQQQPNKKNDKKKPPQDKKDQPQKDQNNG